MDGHAVAGTVPASEKLNRHWCAVIQYPDRAPICVGTILACPSAPDHEVEAALAGAISLCLPDGWRLINMVPGAIFFAPEDGA